MGCTERPRSWLEAGCRQGHSREDQGSPGPLCSATCSTWTTSYSQFFAAGELQLLANWHRPWRAKPAARCVPWWPVANCSIIAVGSPRLKLSLIWCTWWKDTSLRSPKSGNGWTWNFKLSPVIIDLPQALSTCLQIIYTADPGLVKCVCQHCPVCSFVTQANRSYSSANLCLCLVLKYFSVSDKNLDSGI